MKTLEHQPTDTTGPRRLRAVWAAPEPVIDLRDDALSPVRGIVAAAVISLPLWAAGAAMAWKALH